MKTNALIHIEHNGHAYEILLRVGQSNSYSEQRWFEGFETRMKVRLQGHSF